MPTAIALLSGGLDSGTGLAMWLARADHGVELCLTLDYDQRSAAESEELQARAGELIVRRSLNRVNPTWTLAQLLWLRRHEPEAVARVRKRNLAVGAFAAVVALAAAAAFWPRGWSIEGDPRHSIIVFPFENKTADDDKDYWEDASMNLLGLAIEA